MHVANQHTYIDKSGTLETYNADYSMYSFTNELSLNYFYSLDSITFIYLSGKEKLGYPMDKAVYVVLEEDGTEVDEEEYFQTLPENTLLMLLYVGGDKWSPYGLPFK